MPEPRRSVHLELRRAATWLAIATVLSRGAGFIRGLVFVRAVGATDVGDTYTRANTVPNIIFETVAGGALASSIVPVLAGPVDEGDRDRTLRTTAALFTWTVALLVPIAIAGIVLARPLMELLTPARLGGADREQAVAVGARMLAIFSPQIVLYGIAVVLTGVLQAHRRFLGPALAPLLSSLVVAATYLVYAVETHAQPPTLATLTTAQELTLALGTTAGVAVLSLSLLVPLRRAGVPLRAALTFPPTVRSQVVRLSLAGIAALAAQQLSLVVVLRLSYGGPAGTLVLYQLAWLIFLLPWAIFAVPLATSAFPHLVVFHGSGDRAAFADIAATTTRNVLVVICAAAAVLIATAEPVARLFVLHARGVEDPAVLARAIVVLAPGLLGYALVAHIGRALYACGEGRRAAIATVSGWIAVLAADVGLSAATPSASRLEVLAWGNTIGMTIAGLALAWSLHVAAPGSFVKVGYALLTGVAAGAVSAATGFALALWLPGETLWAALLVACAVGAWVILLYGAILMLTNPSAVRAFRAARTSGSG